MFQTLSRERKQALALVTVVLFLALALVQGFNSRTAAAEASLLSYSAPTDICVTGGLTIDAVVGDIVQITDYESSCLVNYLGYWTEIGVVSYHDINGFRFVQLEITSAGSKDGYWYHMPSLVGYLATINATATAPATVPGAPTGAIAVAGNEQATVSFDAPASNGGATITGYTVTSNPGGLTGTGANSPIIVTGLTNGIAYTFTATATNAAGTGEPSAASNAVTPATVPGAPQDVSAVAGDSQATVTFDAPASDGGSAITSYTVTSSPGDISVTGTSSPTIVTGLEEGMDYTFTVTATNIVGTGPASAASTAVTTHSAPWSPTQVSATAGNGQATVTFDVPNDGGSAITEYTVTSSPGDISATGTSDPITVTGLTNGTEYTFMVTATNIIGTSKASQPSNAVTPQGSSSVPFHVIATAGNGQATVTFDEPNDDGGSAITSYTVTSSPGGHTATGVHSPITVTGLTNGVEYTFTVTAINGIGKSPASAVSNAVTPQGGTHIALSTSPNTSVYGNGFALVANVSGEGVPTGTVAFLLGANEIGSATVDENGEATLAIDAGYAAGAYSFRAVYSGSAAHESAESPIASHTVAKSPSTLGLTVSNGHMLVGETVTFTATVPMGVTGTVTFSSNGTVLGTATIVDGVATLAASFGVVGDVEVTATSSGNANHLGATDSVSMMVHASADDVTPPTSTPGNPTETPTPGETPDPTATPEAPTTPGTPDSGTPTTEPTSGLLESAPAGTTVIQVSNQDDFNVGDIIVINQGSANEERRTIVAIDERGIVLNAGLDFAHEAGVSVVLAIRVVPVVGEPAAGQPGAPLPPASGTGLRIIETGPLYALPLVIGILLLASGAFAYGTRRQS